MLAVAVAGLLIGTAGENPSIVKKLANGISRRFMKQAPTPSDNAQNDPISTTQESPGEPSLNVVKPIGPTAKPTEMQHRLRKRLIDAIDNASSEGESEGGSVRRPKI